MVYLGYKNKPITKEEIPWKAMNIIIKLARKMQNKFNANLIKVLNNLISSKQFISQHKLNQTAFTRKRSLPFKYLILFIINLLKSSIQNELDKFFKVINNSELPVRVISTSALTQARKKLCHSAFIEMNKEQTKYFYENANYKKWQGFRLLAIDGSSLKLPKNEETIEEFGLFYQGSKITPTIVARVSQAYDLLNKITVDSIISPFSVGELDLAVKHIKAANKDDMILLDRGYGSFWLFNLLLSQRTNFCARIKSKSWNALRELITSNLKEQIIEISPSAKARVKSEEMNLQTEPIKLRFMCIDLDNGEKEVLATSLLDTEKYPYELFKELYHKRWAIEESYKLMKSRIEMENFTGKSPEVVRQDFYARIFTLNLTAILTASVQEQIRKKRTKKSKYVQQINWTQAIAKMKDSIVLLFVRKNIHKIIMALNKHFFMNTLPIRPNRVFPRNHKPIRHFYIAYKPIA